MVFKPGVDELERVWMGATSLATSSLDRWCDIYLRHVGIHRQRREQSKEYTLDNLGRCPHMGHQSTRAHSQVGAQWGGLQGSSAS